MFWSALSFILDAAAIGVKVLIAVGLTAGGVYLALFSTLPPLRKVGIILIGIGVIYGSVLLGTFIGGELARAECKEGALRSEIANKDNQLKVQLETTAAAKKKAEELQQATDDLSEKVRSYVKTLSVRAVCALSADDLVRLRSIK